MIRDVDFTGAPPPQHATVTDFGQDGWLLPGLVDAHVHLCWDAGTDAVAHVAAGDRDTVLETARASAATALRAGITTVRDLGDRDYLTLELRDLVPPTERPEIVAAGPPITTRGGHCHFLGGETEGADVVRVMASDGNLTPSSSPLPQQYGRSDLRLVVAEAHRLGLAAAAHVHAAEAIGDVMDAGFDTIEHFAFFTAEGVGLRPELLDEVVRRGIVISLTLGMVPGSPPPPAVAARIEAMQDLVGKVIASGARVVAGTDAGIEPYIKGRHPQLGELGQCIGQDVVGFGLRSATAVAAEADGRLRAPLHRAPARTCDRPERQPVSLPPRL